MPQSMAGLQNMKIVVRGDNAIDLPVLCSVLQTKYTN